MIRPKSRKEGNIRRKEEADEPTQLWEKLFDLDQIEALLQASAAEGVPISYSECLGALGYNFTRPKMRALCVALGEIDRRAVERGEPELAVLVVRATDKIPGQGWWVVNKDSNYNGPWDGPQAERYIKAIQYKAFEYWKKR
jgi:hypothetical protein